jgi:predicted RNase H-like nuclease (RuvC/YqgF family)
MVEFLGIQLGTVAQVVTMVFGGGIFGVMITGYVSNRKITKDAEAMLRTHFGDELKRLSEKAKESDDRHDKCEREKRDLREEMEEMHNEIRGLHRKLTEKSTDSLLILEDRGCPSDKAPHAVAAAKRLAGSDK